MAVAGRLDGRVALVTGGGRGIGAATAQRLASEGARVAVVDRDLEPAEETAAALRAGARAYTCDVADRHDVERTVGAVERELGPLDALVNCAGVTRDNLIHKLSDDDWDVVMDVHLKGTFLTAQAAQAAMVPRRRGSMVFLSSASVLGNRGQANYSAAKAGIQGFTRTVALELARFGIRVNCVAPGFVETRMTRAIAERTGADWDGLKRERAAAIPLGRVGQPEEIAAVIAFLCSDDASFMTGQTLYVRGGPA